MRGGRRVVLVHGRKLTRTLAPRHPAALVWPHCRGELDGEAIRARPGALYPDEAVTPGEGPPDLAVVESGIGCRLEERTVAPHRTRAGGAGVMAACELALAERLLLSVPERMVLHAGGVVGPGGALLLPFRRLLKPVR